MGDMADAAMEEQYTDPAPDESRWRGKASEWQAPKGNGPARFKIGTVQVQVWKFEYQSEQVSDTYMAARDLAEEGAFVEGYGKEEENSFFSTKAQRNITTTQRTLYGIEKVEATEDDPQTVANVTKAATRGKGGQQREYLSKEEWAEKDRITQMRIDVWAALKIAVPALSIKQAAGLIPQVTTADVEALARALVQIGERLVKEKLETGTLASGSDSATASPSTTSAEAPSSAPVAKASGRSSRSKKPAQTSASG